MFFGSSNQLLSIYIYIGFVESTRSEIENAAPYQS